MNDYRPSWMDENLDIYRNSVSRFVENEMQPHDERWREQGHIDKEVWRKAGAQGFLCSDIPAEYGGGGADFRYEAVFFEEQWRRGLTGMGQVYTVLVPTIFTIMVLKSRSSSTCRKWLAVR